MHAKILRQDLIRFSRANEDAQILFNVHPNKGGIRP
jgi:hypothetical protein